MTDALDHAIVHTLAYADVFDYPLSAAEVHRYLIGAAAVPAEIDRQLSALSNGRKQIEQHGDWFVLPGRAENCAARRNRAFASARLWAQAQCWAARIAALPFVRMVAITGALSMNNAPNHDDIDLFLITQPRRVWLTRAMTVGMVRLARLAGTGLCPNYVLAVTALAQTQQNLFIAHEIAQMVPLFGDEVYHQLRAANGWTEHWLPNASGPPQLPIMPTPLGGKALQAKHGAENMLGGAIGDWLDAHEQRRKSRKFARYQRNNPAAAQLDQQHAKGHFNDHGAKIMQNYQLRVTKLKIPAAAGADNVCHA